MRKTNFINWNQNSFYLFIQKKFYLKNKNKSFFIYVVFILLRKNNILRIKSNK